MHCPIRAAGGPLQKECWAPPDGAPDPAAAAQAGGEVGCCPWAAWAQHCMPRAGAVGENSPREPEPHQAKRQASNSGRGTTSLTLMRS